MTVYGYKRTLVGTIAAIIFFIQTIGQIAYMVMITYDYYNGNLMFRGFTVVNTGTFMGMWYIYFIWFACLTIFKSRLSNFFRIRCAYDQGQYVQVERKEPSMLFYLLMYLAKIKY
jgi:cation-transporting ATPase 13A3/4/5